jgi:thymidine kinase
MMTPERHTTTYARDPEFIIYTGPMFGAKTSRLLSAVDRCKYQNMSVAVFKPKMDDRYSSGTITTHTGMSIPAVCVKSGDDILQAVGALESCDVVAVDEAFMIDGSAAALLVLFRQGTAIIVSSIQLSASGLPFEEMRDMMPYATRIEVCPAVCPITGRDAYYTERKMKDLGEIAVGGSDLYYPVCWKHHHYMNKKG